MTKSAKSPVQAAGGIVVRAGAPPLVAVVQRRRDGAWVLPKGKLKANEEPIAAAKREVVEETGYAVSVHEFLGVISYVAGSGPKLAHFWRMQALDGGSGKLADDIKAMEWLPLAVAIDRLNLPHERAFLREMGARVLAAVKGETPPPVANVAAAASDHGEVPPRRPVLAWLTKRFYAAVRRARGAK